MSESTRIPQEVIQHLRETCIPRAGSKLVDRDFALRLHNCLIAYPETTGADIVHVWHLGPLIPRRGTPTSEQLAILWESDNRYGGVDRQFLEYRMYNLMHLMRKYPDISAGWFRQGYLFRDDFDVKNWFPTTQELEELDEAYIAAQMGERSHVESYRAHLSDMLAQYPRLNEREMVHLHQDRVNSRHNLPGPRTLQRLNAYFYIANAEYDMEDILKYGTCAYDTLECHPHLSLAQLARLQSGSVHRREFTYQPTNDELRVLDEHYLAAQNGNRAQYDAYFLLLVETLRRFPQLTATDLNALHSGMSGNGGQQ